jgi:hypothetical protein
MSLARTLARRGGVNKRSAAVEADAPAPRKVRRSFARAYALSRVVVKAPRPDLRNKHDPQKHLCRHRLPLPNGTHHRCPRPATKSGYCGGEHG